MLGVVLVVALFAALIVPRFIDWSDYTAAFEARAEQILGHPVKVGGTAEASILPSPSLTFTDVTVGVSAENPMATVERFEATIELMPLLQGEIRVTSMRMVAPRITIRSDNRGLIDWFQRSPTSDDFDPDRVVLESVQIEDGALTFVDDRFGVSHSVDDIRALVSARSLAGPWRADDASLSANGQRYQFNVATGRLLDDGELRVKVDVQPRRMPVDVTVDGKLRSDPIRGLTYQGTYNARMIGTAPDGSPDTAGWRSEGAFNAVLGGIDIQQAVLSHGPPDRPLTLAGSLKILFGDAPRFSAAVQANQIDLDRTLGAGPAEPLDVPAAVEKLITVLRDVPKPPVVGDIIVDVPVIVAGGAIIQGFRLDAEIGPRGMTVSNLIAELPGRATATLDGRVRTDDRMGFKGEVGLSVLQPATFAGWWRGNSAGVEDAARLLSNFELAGSADIRPGLVKLDQLRARVGASEISGQFNWSSPRANERRILSGQLTADRFDVVQLRSLGELLVGQNIDGVDALADDYIFNISANEVAVDNVIIEDIAIDASYTRDGLRVNQFSIGDPQGDSFTTFSGNLIDLAEANPTGTLQGQIRQVSEINFLVWAVNRFLPESPLAKWLTLVGPNLAPAVLNVSIEPVAERRGAIRMNLVGVAGPTTLNVTVEGAASSQLWQDEPVSFDLMFDSPDSQSLLRQAGTGLTLPADRGVAHVEIRGGGVPSAGMATTIQAEIGGVSATAKGTLTLDQNGRMAFSGEVADGTGAIGDVASLLGFAPSDDGRTISDLIEGSDPDGSQRIVLPSAAVNADDDRVELTWRNAIVGERRVNGTLAWARVPDLGWRMSGELAVSELDLDWLMALGLGSALMPTDDPEVPWARTPFGAAALGSVAGDVVLEAERFRLAQLLEVANARAVVNLDPQRFDLKLESGLLAGGKASGNLTVHNVAGNSRLAGAITVEGAALDSFMWNRDGRAIASGDLDFTANFEATGRSPAGLITSLTGGGVIEVSDGVARYINPNAARPVIRESDVGQAFTEESLRAALEGTLDAGSLVFGDATGSFVIAGGALRTKNLTLKGDGVEARGEAVLDFNTMQTRADWTVSLDPGDRVVESTVPEVGLVFTGPIAAPVRRVDVLPFDSYLNMRLEARMLERIELEEAERLEAERLRRVVRKFEQDAERRRTAAERAAAASLEASMTAEQLTVSAADARAAATSADELLAAALAARDAAMVAADEAGENAERLSGVRDAAAGERTEALGIFDVAETRRARALEARDMAGATESDALERLRQATAAHEAAIDEADASRDTHAAAQARTDEARAVLTDARAVVADTQSDLAAAEMTANEADAVLREAEDIVAEGRRNADALAGVVIMADSTVREAEAAAVSAAARAEADQVQRETVAATAQASLEVLQAAQQDAADAAARVDAVIAIGEQLTSSETATDVDRQAAADLAASARRQAELAASVAADAEAAHQNDLEALETASARSLVSDGALEEAEQASRDAVAALAVAQEADQGAVADVDAAQHRLEERTAERDAAATRLSAARRAADEGAQQRDAARAAFNITVADLFSAASTMKAATASRDSAGAAAEQAAAEAVDATEMLALAEAEVADAEADAGQAANRLAAADAALEAALAALREAQAAHAAAQTTRQARVAEHAAAEAEWQRLDRVAIAAERAASAARVTADELALTADQARVAASWISPGSADIAAFLEAQAPPSPPPTDEEDAAAADSEPAVESDTEGQTEASTPAADATVDDEQTETAAASVAIPRPKLRPDQPLVVSP